MKKPVIIISLAVGLSLAACTGPSHESNTPPPNMTTPGTSVPGSPTEEPDYPEGVSSMDAAEMNEYLPDPSDINIQAVLADEDTVYLQLTGSSSCPSIPETITAENGSLVVKTHDWKGNCTADLGTSGWEITLPAELVPRTEPLEILIYIGNTDPAIITAEPLSETNQSQNA